MTAVEWLVEQLTSIGVLEIPQGSNVVTSIIEQAIEMEKQQGYSEEDVKNAFLDGWQLRDGDLPFPKAKKEWFEQFKK